MLMTEPEAEPDSAENAAAAEAADTAERELVERARAQPPAFGQLYDLYYGRILNYVYRRTLDVAAAEEITSNTFFNALRALPKYDNRGRFAAWLYRIATNEIRLHHRSGRNRPEGNSQWREEFGRVRFSSPWAVDPLEEDVEEKMRQFARLHDALSRLPERYQTVLALRYFEALSLAETAAVLGKRLGTVKSLIHRGLERLKRQLEAGGPSFLPNVSQQVDKEP
jgi:RNA polymerase sigma-70 factor, ECF subfamily